MVVSQLTELGGDGSKVGAEKEQSAFYQAIDRVDLLVMNTKDEDQLAMHGLAYPLAVELRQIPLLML